MSSLIIYIHMKVPDAFHFFNVVQGASERIDGFHGAIKLVRLHQTMLGGSLVTTAWHVLRLRMEGTASRYGG
jgi:hypothetical protein